MSARRDNLPPLVLRFRDMRFRPINSAAPSVLVVDEGFMGSLHAALGLRRAGMRVVLLGAVGGRSSYEGDGFTALTGPTPAAPDFVSVVTDTKRRFGCDLVYATTEPSMLALADDAATHPRMSSEQRRLVADKRAMSALAAAHGVPVPAERALREGSDVERAAAELGLPLVIKTSRGRGGDGTAIVRTSAEARAFLERARVAGREAYAQPLVDGRTYLAGGLFRDGEPLGMFACLKVEQHPPRTGPAIRTRSTNDAPLLQAAASTMRALRWSGLASMDFIRDRDGRFLFLEVNPRPWGSIAATWEAGVDLLTPLAEMLCGHEPSRRSSARADVETHVLPLYLLSRDYYRVSLAGRLLDDLRSIQGEPFRDPAFLPHVLYRLRRVKGNWRAV